MKKLKIDPSRLVIRRAEIPTNSDLQVIKISYNEAMSFVSGKYPFFRSLLRTYGVANRLKEGEYYQGYAITVITFLFEERAEIVYMDGYIQKIDPQCTKNVLNHNMSERIRKECAWKCLCSPDNGETTEGRFGYVYTFRGCDFAEHIHKAREMRHFYRNSYEDFYKDVDAEAFDETLKDKLINALLSSEHIVEVTDIEDRVLRGYFGRRNYYDKFFAEVPPSPSEIITL